MRITFERAILSLAAKVVPRSERAEWSREWTSELWYLQQSNRPAIAFCLGAFKDAVWIRRNSPKESRVLLQSPWHCLLVLGSLAALTTLMSFYLSVPRQMLRLTPVFIHLLLLGIAVIVLPIARPLTLGDYPVTAHSPSRVVRFLRWMFLAAKIVCILPIVFLGTLDLAGITGVIGVQPDIALVGYVLALRWVLKDQCQRCPVCLRLLVNPMRIGEPSQTLLGWYGCELMCEKGHGLLYVPAIRSSYTIQRWLYLDPSWRSLFS